MYVLLTYMEPATAGSRMRESTYRFILLKTTTNVDLETRHIILEKVSEMVQSAAISSSLSVSSIVSLSCRV